MTGEKSKDNQLEIDLAGVALRNPLLLAAGTAGYGDELADALDLSRVGGVVTKSITREPRSGNETWRIIEARRGMLNAIGLANVGADAFERDMLPALAKAPTTIIGSIAGGSVDDYTHVASMFDRHEHVPAVELNVSCPNVHSGASFGESPELLGELIKEVRPALAHTKLFVKLPPLITGLQGASIIDVAGAAIESGADGLTLCNTFPAMAIDVKTRKPRLSNVTGGLSGPAIHPITLRLVHQVYTSVAAESGVPIIAAGGVLRWEDAAAFMLAGASAFEMGTALFADPRSPGRVLDGLRGWLRSQDCECISDLIGAMARGGAS